VTVMSEPTTAGTRQWSRPAADDWIQRSRPPERPLPGHRHLRVAAEDVGGGQFGRHPLLAGIDERQRRGHGLDLVDVVGLDGIAEDDAHAHGFHPKGLKLASRGAENAPWHRARGLPRRVFVVQYEQADEKIHPPVPIVF
jgi:hypothetical protein